MTDITINKLHKAVLDVYAEGEFAALGEQDFISSEQLGGLGDGLLIFLLVELDEANSCETCEDAIDGIKAGKDELDAALVALKLLKAEIQHKKKSN